MEMAAWLNQPTTSTADRDDAEEITQTRKHDTQTSVLTTWRPPQLSSKLLPLPPTKMTGVTRQ